MFEYYVLKELELSKSNILTKISAEDVFRYYVGDFKINKTMKAPYRVDKTRTN